MENKEIRQRNFRYLADKMGRDIFARACGWDGVGYANAACTGHDKIGDNVARKVERSLKLSPVGWMDLPHPELWGFEVAGYDPVLAEALRRVEGLSPADLPGLLAYLRALAEMNSKTQ